MASPTSRSILVAVNQVIAETAAGRQSVLTAIDGLQACTASPYSAQESLSQVVVQRQQARSQLTALENSPSTPGADHRVIERLMAVINDSIQADQSYAAWMGDVAAAPTACRSAPASDPNLEAGQVFSAKADQDKRVFVDAWNSMARPAGIATYQPQDF